MSRNRMKIMQKAPRKRQRRSRVKRQLFSVAYALNDFDHFFPWEVVTL